MYVSGKMKISSGKHREFCNKKIVATLIETSKWKSLQIKIPDIQITLKRRFIFTSIYYSFTGALAIHNDWESTKKKFCLFDNVT
uniref:(California timema) hypothetical protein n=1 Tax=Timema californicum TaxID=61474 RepID=A0A7R9IY81_TIMCA|nr:unnamed protein product [Timema californicum]